jgi:hypothetical protein
MWVWARGLAASGTAVIAFFVAAVLPSATWPLIDGDVWWHLRAGEEILATGVVSRVDTWSILGQGREWISQDWLANAAMAAVRGIGPLGETTLSFVFGLVVVAAMATLWQTIQIRNASISWAARMAWLTLGLILAAPVLGVRVQVLDLVLSAIVVWLLARYVADRRRRWLVGLPIVAVAWANLHAGWPMLFLLGGALLVGESIDRVGRRIITPEPLSVIQLRDLGVALVIGFGALALNPNGTALWAYPLNTVSIAVLGRHIVEWFPVTADPRLLVMYIGFIAVAVIPTLVLGRTSLRTADVLVVIGLTIMAGYAVRFLLLAGPLLAVIAAATLTPRLATTRIGYWARPIVGSLSVPRGGRLGIAHLLLGAGLAILGVAISLAKVVPSAQAAIAEGAFPVGAVAWLEAEEPGDRVFNRYEWGGYLGHRRPDRLVFIDGRADVYGDELLTRYAAVISLQADPEAELDRYEIDHVLFPPESAFAGWLDASPDWQRAYADSVAVIWVRSR